MSDLIWLSEAQMRRIEPYFPLSHGMPKVDDRRVISGIIFVIRNGLDDAARWQLVQQMLRRFAVGLLSRRQQKGGRPALAVGDGMDLGVAPAPADADRTEARPPFPPAAERCALTCVLSISTSVGGPPSAARASNTARHPRDLGRRWLQL